MSSTAYAKYHSTPLSSSTESEALRIGDPEIADWIPVCAGMTRLESFASNENDTPFVILNRKQSASDWGSRDYRLDSRFHGNDTPRVILSLTGDLIGSGFPFSRE